MKHNNEDIILIEYFNDIPFSVMTEYTTYDFEMHAGGWLMFYRSGGSGYWKEKNGKKIIKATFEFCNPEAWKIWIDSQYTIVTEIQKGITILKNPLMLPDYINEKLKYNNPFKAGQEVEEIYYCKPCKAFYTEDGCNIHRKEYE